MKKAKIVNTGPVAMAALRLVAEQGDAHAQFKLGLAYYSGDGVTKDRAEAVKWFCKPEWPLFA